MKRTGFLLAGLVVALVLAGLVSPFASGSPDGLEHTLLRGCTLDDEGEIVAGSCPAQAEEEHGLADSPLADYAVRGLDHEGLATGLSGVVGVLITLAVAGGLFWLVRRRAPAPAGGTTGAAGASGAAGPATDATSAAGPAEPAGRG